MGSLGMKDALYFYQKQRVFITGHTGFKGSWLTLLLSELGADVTGYSLPSHDRESHFEQLALRQKINHIEGDVRNIEHLVEHLQVCAPQVVFHLAAQPLVKQSYLNPIETFSTNLMGSVHLLEAVRHTPSVKVVVFITSDKCYENHEWIWGYRENDRLGGHDPYSASKAGAENIFSAYWRSFLSQRSNFGAATTRAGNVIGGGDWANDRIIPDCIRAIKRNTSIELRNPKATRPWQHVLEPLSGYLLLGAKLGCDPKNYSGAWNFGPSSDQCRTVDEIANYIVKYFEQGQVSVHEGQHQHEAQLLQLNCDKAHQLLGWYPRWNVNQTLVKTAEWYKSVLAGVDVVDVTKAQIYDYFQELD